MPLYEYHCIGCGRKVTLLVRGFERPARGGCPRCGSTDLKRVFSTFRMAKTDKDVYEDILGDNRLVKRMMANDPKALVEWNNRMSQGEEAVAPEYEDMMGKMSAGEWPEKTTGAKKKPAAAEESD